MLRSDNLVSLGELVPLGILTKKLLSLQLRDDFIKYLDTKPWSMYENKEKFNK